MARARLRLEDRQDAGRLLAGVLDLSPDADAVVFGIPRGGVVVAAAVADALGAPLDVVVVRKLGHPSQREAALGAVAEEGVLMPEGLHAGDPAVERLGAEVAQRVRAYRAGRPRAAAGGRTAVVVDDGLATGFTFAAALEVVARDRPDRLIGAVPVASEEGLTLAAGHCDQTHALLTVPAGSFFAVSLYYRRFGQVNEREVQALLRARSPGPGAG